MTFLGPSDVLLALVGLASKLDTTFKVYARCVTADGHEFDGWCVPTGKNPWSVRYRKHDHKLGIDAEIMAMTNALIAGHEVKGSTLYVARAKRLGRGKPFTCGFAKPCEGCTRAIKDLGVRRVFYTSDAPDIYYEISVGGMEKKMRFINEEID